MEIVLEESKKDLPGLKVVVLTVFANNKVTIEMYKKYSFIEYSRLPKGLNHRNKFVDEIYMYKKL